MNHHLQNLVWSVIELLGPKHRGNLIADILNVADSRLSPDDFERIDCSYRVYRRMLDRSHLRTMFFMREGVFEKLEALMIEIYRDYERNRDGQSVLFYPKGSLNPVSAMGRGRGYDFIHIVRERSAEQPHGAANVSQASSSETNRTSAAAGSRR